MVVRSAGYVPVPKISYLFVDGAYLRESFYALSNTLFDGEQIPLDFGRVGAGFTKCFYYDCLPFRTRAEDSAAYDARVLAQRTLFSAIRTVDGWHVFEGVTVGEGSRARQKQVDIQIAVDMLSHSHQRNMQELDFIAGDQDFKPLIDALVRDGMYVRLLYERTSASKELIEAADARHVLNAYELLRFATAQFSESHRLPERSSQQGDTSPPAGTLVETGSGLANNIRLWRAQTRYVITYAGPERRGNTMHLAHNNLDFLKRVMHNVLGTVAWTPS
jgi:uncharacterized LabA/DUF88 family protein